MKEVKYKMLSVRVDELTRHELQMLIDKLNRPGFLGRPTISEIMRFCVHEEFMRSGSIFVQEPPALADQVETNGATAKDAPKKKRTRAKPLNGPIQEKLEKRAKRKPRKRGSK